MLGRKNYLVDPQAQAWQTSRGVRTTLWEPLLHTVQKRLYFILFYICSFYFRNAKNILCIEHGDFM